MCIIPFCVCAGKLQGHKYEKWLDIARRVYDAKGVCPTLTTVQSGGTEAKVVIRVKENTARGYSDFTLGGGICDLSYPNSTTRRGRIQRGGLVSPTLTTGNTGICAVRFERGGE